MPRACTLRVSILLEAGTICLGVISSNNGTGSTGVSTVLTCPENILKLQSRPRISRHNIVFLNKPR